jgi:hypothetical protein
VGLTDPCSHHNRITLFCWWLTGLERAVDGRACGFRSDLKVTGGIPVPCCHG